MIRDTPIESSIESFITADRVGLNTAIPASIESYDEATRTARVKIHYSDHFASEGTEANREDWPPIPDCPVLFPRGGGFVFTWPLKKGDPVLVVFSQRSLQEWSASDGKTDIGSFLISTHNPGDAIVISGLSPSKNKDGEDTEIKITTDGELQVKSSKVRLGTLDAAKALALAEKVDAAIQNAEAKINAIVAAALAGGGLVLGVTPLIPAQPTASAKVFTDS